jgi:hypothetical protein
MPSGFENSTYKSPYTSSCGDTPRITRPNWPDSPGITRRITLIPVFCSIATHAPFPAPSRVRTVAASSPHQWRTGRRLMASCRRSQAPTGGPSNPPPHLPRNLPRLPVAAASVRATPRRRPIRPDRRAGIKKKRRLAKQRSRINRHHSAISHRPSHDDGASYHNPATRPMQKSMKPTDTTHNETKTA